MAVKVDIEKQLSGLMKKLVSKTSLSGILKLVLDSIENISGSSVCSIFLMDKETRKLKQFCRKGADSELKAKKAGYDLVLPMVVNKRNLGEVRIQWKQIKKLTSKQKSMLSLIAACGAIAVEKSLYEKERNVISSANNLDGLTQLYNHKYFYETLNKELYRAMRFTYPICVAMMDLDHFKKYNDTYGHPSGDYVLKKVADIIKKNIRSYDTACRYGGEEFAIILPHCISRQALNLIDRIRKEIMEYPFNEKDKDVAITISTGLASFPSNATTQNGLVKRADQALYLAKEEGRNRICFSLVTSKDLINCAFCPPAFTSPYYTSILKGVMEVVEDVGNIKLITEAPKSETHYVEEQLDIIEKHINEKVDVLAICSTAEKLVAKVVKKANQAGIPVFFFNVPKILPFGEIVSYISYDNVEAGKMVAHYLVRLLREEGKVAILEGLPEITSNERKEGFVQIIKDYPDISIVESVRANWSRELAKKISSKLLKDNPDLDAIFGVSDEMALGASDAVMNIGKKDKVFTIGLDGNQNAIQAIKEGKLTATLNTNPTEMGKTLMRTILRNMIKGEKIQKHIWLKINMVNYENAEQYLHNM